MNKNQYNLTQDEQDIIGELLSVDYDYPIDIQDELDAFLTELDTQSRLEQSETDFDREAQAKEEETYYDALELEYRMLMEEE